MLPDNYDLWARHDAEQQAQLDKLPKCAECGEPIQQKDCLRINDEYFCDRCLEDLRVEIQGEIYG